MGAHVHPISLSLVDMSAPTKRVSPPHRLATAAPGHLAAGSHQAEDAPCQKRALADGEDGGIRAVAAVVDADAAALSRTSSPDWRARASAGRMPAENSRTSVSNVSAVPKRAGGGGPVPLLDALGGLLHQHLDPEGLDLVPQHGAAASSSCTGISLGRTPPPGS